MKGLRTFIGIFPPPEIQRTIAAIQSSFKVDNSLVRWESQNKFHITVKFLGDVAEKQLGQLQSVLDAAAGTIPPFEITLLSVGCFPSVHSPKIVWIGSPPDDNPDIVRCFGAVEDACAEVGFKKNERAFHPHITLGRVKGLRPRRGKISGNLIKTIENTTFEPLIFPCTELLIMKSDLSPSGSTYSKQRTISLKH
jgi:2'-5' RNA ligase